ncbi:MAG: hypothetical protein M3430_03715 [Acidobacteriota bacterium]|nr:hypothetical protein [Acidobacteriota bacterium]
MNREEIPQALWEWLTAPPLPPLETVRELLHAYIADDSMDEERERIRRRITTHPGTISNYPNAIESLIVNPPAKEGVFARSVAWDANRGIDDTSDEGAKAWLKGVAEIVREVLGDQQPPRPSTPAERVS